MNYAHLVVLCALFLSLSLTALNDLPTDNNEAQEEEVDLHARMDSYRQQANKLFGLYSLGLKERNTVFKIKRVCSATIFFGNAVDQKDVDCRCFAQIAATIARSVAERSMPSDSPFYNKEYIERIAEHEYLAALKQASSGKAGSLSYIVNGELEAKVTALVVEALQKEKARV